MDKKGFIYSTMSKYRMKFTAIVVIALVLFVFYSSYAMPFVMKKLFGATPLDTQRFKTEDTFVLNPDFVCDEKSQNAKIYNYAQKETSYFQDGKYYFEVTVDDVINMDVSYTYGGAVVTDEVDTNADKIALNANLIVTDGITIPVLTSPTTQIHKGDVIKGILTPNSTRILEQFAKKSKGETVEISKYTLDARGIGMVNEYSDFFAFTGFLLVLIFLIIKLIIYYVKPLSHPMLKQLERYGEIPLVAEDIDKEINDADNAVFSKDCITTENWVLNKKTFKYSITKKLPSESRFRYTPDFK